jgi:hypothetical protein
LKKVDSYIKEKFSNFWISVRKAFLDLDFNHDGLIEVEDIMRFFGPDADFSFKDLKKLMIEKD